MFFSGNRRLPELPIRITTSDVRVFTETSTPTVLVARETPHADGCRVGSNYQPDWGYVEEELIVFVLCTIIIIVIVIAIVIIMVVLIVVIVIVIAIIIGRTFTQVRWFVIIWIDVVFAISLALSDANLDSN